MAKQALRPKATKLEADYTNTAAMPNQRCELCIHFIPQTSCDRVMGMISAKGWCKYFTRIGRAR